MVDLFKDIPEERIEFILQNIKNNLERLDLRDGHTISRHVDIQLGLLKTRLTVQDIRFATSFYDLPLARAAVIGLLKQTYDEKIVSWLLTPTNDVLVLRASYRRAIGYGYRKEEDNLYEGLSKMRLVLEKEAERDWGFRILTCFPIF